MSDHSVPARPLVLPTLRGKRVTLRAFTPTDAPAIQEASADELIPLISTVPTTGDEGAAIAFIERQHDRLRTGAGYSFAIADENGEAVGQLGLWLRDADFGRAGVGYWVKGSARRNGYAADALAALVAWARDLPGIHRLELYVEPWNEASIATAERAGFEREGLLRSWQQIGDERRDLYMYSLLAGG